MRVWANKGQKQENGRKVAVEYGFYCLLALCVGDTLFPSSVFVLSRTFILPVEQLTSAQHRYCSFLLSLTLSFFFHLYTLSHFFSPSFSYCAHFSLPLVPLILYSIDRLSAYKLLRKNLFLFIRVTQEYILYIYIYDACFRNFKFR